MRCRAIPDSEQLLGVTMLRGIAVSLLVVHHTLEASLGASVGPRSSNWLTRIGESGIDLLFVIAGFMMLYRSFAHGNKIATPGEFLLRRLIRIFPFYWVCCCAFLAIWSVGFLKSRDLTLSAIVKSLFLIPTSETLIGPSWILSYLVYYYLIFCSTLFLRSRDASVMLSTAAILVFLALGQFVPTGDLSDFLTKPIALEFCFGLLLARFCISGRVNCAATWCLMGFAALAVAPPFVSHPDESGLPGLARILVWGLPGVLLLASFLQMPSPKTLVVRFSVVLGSAAYAIYLTHFFVMIFYQKLLKDTPLSHHSQIVIIPAVIAACIAVGLATHIVVERPLVSLILKLSGLPCHRVHPTEKANG